MATGTNAWSLPVLINNLEARVNALGGGGGGVTNPLTANLAAAGYNVTGVGQLTASRLGVSLGATDTATVADTIGNTWLSVDVGGNVQLGTAGGLGTVRAPLATPATDSSTKVATTAFVQNAVSGGTTTQVASPVVLTVASTANQLLTGSLAYIVTLPDATTLALGRTFFINVNTSAPAYTCTINGFTGTPIVSNAQQGSALELILLTNSTSAGTWDAHSYLPNGANFGTSGLVYQGNLTLTGSSAKTIGTSGTGNLTVQTNSTGTLALNSVGGPLSLQSASTTTVSVDNTGVTFGPSATSPVRIWTGAGTDTQVIASAGTVPIGNGYTVFGQKAALVASGGQGNTAIGTFSSGSQTAAAFNTTVGWNAGAAHTTASFNTFLGAGAGQGSTGGSNTTVGYSAGLQTTTGTGNTIIGADSLGAAGANDAIVIGRAAVNTSGVGVSNEIVIGTTAAGNGSNTITLGSTSSTTLFTPPTIRPTSGTALTLGSATTTTLTAPPTYLPVTGTTLTLGSATTTTLYAPPLAILGGAGRLLGNTLAVDSSTTPLELQTGGITRASVTTTGLIGVRRPTVTGFGLGATSYTPPAGAIWLKVRIWGGGGSGSWATNQRNSGGAGPFSGTAGGTSTFVNNAVTYLSAAGGGGAGAAPYVQQGGFPGSNAASGLIDFVSWPGGYGMSGFQQTTGVYGFAGGMGGISHGGAPGVLVNGNTYAGSGFSSIGTYGGGGAGGNTAIASGGGNWSGGGGAAGGYLEGWIPVSLLVGASTVTVAAGGTIPGGVSTPGNSLEGTSGANGSCIIEAYY